MQQIDSLFTKAFECNDSAVYFRKNNDNKKAKFYDQEMDRWGDSVYTIYETYFPEEFCEYMDHWGGMFTKKERNFCILFKVSGKKDPILWKNL